MKVNSRITSLLENALSQSMHVDMMVKVARRIFANYDVYERSGFPTSIPMPRADAARQIVRDAIGEGYVLKLIEILVDVHFHGVMGREVPIPLLPRIIAEVEDQGYRYSAENGTFLEAAGREPTMGWGTLREGRTYEFALLRADIVGNSELVRRYPKGLITSTFGTVREMVARLVQKRDGRIWSWEGDGGLAAFYFDGKTIQATLCGIEIIQELFQYNLLSSGLPEPLSVRLAVHAGPCRFFLSAKESSGDTIRRVELLESSYTVPGCLTLSPGVYTDLGGKLSSFFEPVAGPDARSVYRYRLEWEKR